MPKAKKLNKTKEQLVEEMRRKREVNRKRAIIVDKFYPALVKATISVDEAKALVQAMSTLLMEQVLRTMKERKFDEIMEPMLKTLTTDGERAEEVNNLLCTLQGENLFVAREIIEGMTRAIDATVHEELRERKMETLKPNWSKYLNG